MTKKKTTVLPKFEILFILVFFLSFLFWAVPKCTSTKEEYQAIDEEEQLIDAYLDSLKKAAEVELQEEDTAPISEPEVQPNSSSAESYTALYITIEGMNIRSAPTVKSKVLDRLNLFDEVAFMNEVTNTRDTITLGTITAVEPWIKIKTRKGKVGWVYGAGVNYYKKKLEGVE